MGQSVCLFTSAHQNCALAQHTALTQAHLHRSKSHDCMHRNRSCSARNDNYLQNSMSMRSFKEYQTQTDIGLCRLTGSEISCSCSGNLLITFRWYFTSRKRRNSSRLRFHNPASQSGVCSKAGARTATEDIRQMEDSRKPH